MKFFLQLFIFLFALNFNYAQNYFTGTVVEEETTTRVSQAIVAIEGTAFAETTNENGAFAFNDKLNAGEYVVTVAKDGYETKFFLIQVIQGQKVTVDQIKLEITKKERKRRKKAAKEAEKIKSDREKEAEKRLDEVRKEKRKQEKMLAKQQKRDEKKKRKEDTPVIYQPETPVEVETETTASEDNSLTEIQMQYGETLGVDAVEIDNIPLYEFVDKWKGTSYVLGGATEDGIDCSSFTQRLYATVYELYIERTAEKQFRSKLTDKFQGKAFLKEGDLVFFKGSGDNSNTIVHVGIYLKNNWFVHSTSYTRDSGYSGVKLGNLSDSYWSRKFVAGGRRIVN